MAAAPTPDVSSAAPRAGLARFLTPVIASRVGTVWLSCIWLFCLWRAATLAFVTDEAFSYQIYVGAEPFSLFRSYDANLHVLHTLLTYFSVKLFGLSELSFRLPTLAACAIYLLAVRRLCRIAFPDSLASLLGIWLLTANPLILDHLTLGRGYGLALACFAWALVHSLKMFPADSSDAATPPPTDGGLTTIATLLALSIAANLTFLFPALALLLMLSALHYPVPAQRRRIVPQLIGPCFVFTFLLLVLPFSRLEPGSFYYGSDSALSSFQILMEHSLGNQRLPVLATSAFASLTIAAGLIALAGAFFRPSTRPSTTAPRSALDTASRNTFSRSAARATLTIGTLLTTLLGLLAANQLFGVLYPWGRTGIYLLFLLPLAWLSASSIWKESSAPVGRAVAGVSFGGLGLAALAMTLCIHPNYFMEWRFDAASREILREIERRRPPSATSVQIFTVPPLQNTLRLYRDLRHLDWIESIQVDGWNPAADYYVLHATDLDPDNPFSSRSRSARLDFETLYRSEVAQTILAVRPSPSPRLDATRPTK